MKNKFKNIFYKFLNLSLLLVPLSVFAQTGGGGGGTNPGGGGGGGGTNPVGSITIKNPLKNPGNLYTFIRDVINDIVLPIGGVAVVIFIIYSGFLFVTAQGNDQKLAKAKTNFLYVVIGTAILLGAWVIAIAIESTINQLT